MIFIPAQVNKCVLVISVLNADISWSFSFQKSLYGFKHFTGKFLISNYLKPFFFHSMHFASFEVVSVKILNCTKDIFPSSGLRQRREKHETGCITWSVFCMPHRRKNVITWPEFSNRGLKPTVPEASRKKALVHGCLRWIVGSVILCRTFRRISQLWDDAHTLNLENCLLYLLSTISQFFDFVRCIVFDFIFYCMTAHPLYTPYTRMPRGRVAESWHVEVICVVYTFACLLPKSKNLRKTEKPFLVYDNQCFFSSLIERCFVWRASSEFMVKHNVTCR